MNIEEAIEKYQELGYEFEEAESKVCQDIILLKISQSKFSKNITIKGGLKQYSSCSNSNNLCTPISSFVCIVLSKLSVIFKLTLFPS